MLSTGGTSYNPPVKLKKKKPAVMPKPVVKHPPLARPKLKTQPAPKPYDPYAPLDPKAIDENARARAQSQIQPTLDNLASVGRDTAGAHATRQGELTNWYGNFQSGLDKSYANTSQALNQLITLNSAGNTEAAAAIAAALRGSDKTVQDAGAMMGAGTPMPQDQDAQILAAAQANAANQNNFVGASAANALSAQGARDATLANVGRIDAGNTEDRRYNAQQQELQNQRSDALARLPDLTTTARGDIQSQEAQKMQLGEAKANRLFQQYLAEQELGIKKKNESFQEWLGTQQLGVSQDQQSLDEAKFSHQTKIDWANVGINRTQADAELARIKADAAGGGKERSKLRAKQWTTGLEMLSGYMTPQKGEGQPGDERTSYPDPTGKTDIDGNVIQVPQRVYRRTYDDALRTLTGKARMSRSDALRMLATSDFPSWRSRAKREMSGVKPDLRKPIKKALSAAQKASSHRVTVQPLRKR